MPMTHGKFTEHLRDDLEFVSEWDDGAIQDYRMVSLDQWDSADLKALEDEGRPGLTFDRLRPLVQAIAGSQQTNRFQSTFVAREYTLASLDRYISAGAREWARWVQQVGDWEHEESAAFFDCLTCGIGVLEIYLTHDIDPDGRIMLRRRPPWEVLWPASSVQPNMRDADHVISDHWMREDEVASIFGQEMVEDVIAAAESTATQPRRSGFWQGLFSVKTTEENPAYSLRRPRSRDDRFYDFRRRQIRMFKMEHFEREYRVRVISPDLRDMDEAMDLLAAEQEQTGEPPTGALIPRLDTFEKPKDADALVGELQEKVIGLNQLISGGMQTAGPLRDPVTVDDFPVRYYYRSWHTHSEMLKEQMLPYDGFSHLFLTCHEDWSMEDSRHFFGLIRQGTGPQKFANKMLSQTAHLYSANPKGALMAEESLFTNKAEALEEWNKASGFITVQDGGLSGPSERFKQLTSNVRMQDAEDLLSFALSSVSASMGLSEAVSLGAVGDVRRISGEALSSLMQQNITTQSAPFDSLRLYRKMVGRLLLGYTDAYADPEQVKRVVGDVKDDAFLDAMQSGLLQQEYDVIADEKPISVNEREELFRAVYESGILPQLVSQGVPIPPEMADIFPGDPEMVSQLKIAFQKAYDVQVLNLEVQKLQLMAQLQGGGMAPQPGAPQPGGAPPTEGSEAA